MRWVLRRQEKIKAYFEPNGKIMLERIIKSLQNHFSADWSKLPYGFQEIDDHFNHYPGEPYPTMMINDIDNNDRMIEFYVTGKQYDVYHLAFKGFSKG